MADPLSIAASIAGVISLADIVFIRTRKYLSSARNAEKEVKHLSQEVLLLSGALHSLSRLAHALDTDGVKDQQIDNLRMHHIAACHATLDEVAKKLKKLEDSQTKRKLVWPFVSERTKDLLSEITRHKENINLALTADNMATLLKILSKAEKLQGSTEELVDEVKKTKKIVTRIQQDSTRKAIVDYFLPYNPQQNYEMSLSLRHPRTGLWLTRRPEFQTWLEHPDSALWLSGIPGAGKTVLAGTVIEEALKRCSEKVATVFFFCDYKDKRTQTAENVLSALASQLAIQKEEAYSYLERYHRELHPSRRLESRPNVSGLRKIIADMFKSFDQVYLIVDGLDECGDNTEKVVDGILSLLECSDNVSTALLSRDEYNIRDRLEEDFTGVEIAAHTEDITEYVTSEIEKRISDKSLRIDDLNLKGEILERLIDGAKGMFRWVACQLDFLGDCLSDKECREALSQLPPGLNESYARILHRVPTGKERIVQMILNFIAYAKPQMDIPLLREALSVPEIVGKYDTLDPQSIVREGSIIKLCRSFIRKSNDGCRYEFAHYSVKEFLEGQIMSIPGCEAFQVSESICQLLLAKQCLKYLVFRNFSYLPTEEHELQDHLEMRVKQYPFYLYSSTYWPIFAKAHWADESLVGLANILFQPQKTGNFISWALELTSICAYQLHSSSPLPEDIIRQSELDEEYIQGALHLLPQLVDRKFTTLHMAAALSLPMICSNLICQGVSIDQRSTFGSPLQCAVQGLFLVCRDLGDSDYIGHISPYSEYSHWEGQNDVSEFGTENTIRLLLRSDADRFAACSSPFEGQTLITVSLRVAFETESFRPTATLIEAGYDLEEEDLKQFTRLGKDALKGDSLDEYCLKSLILALGPRIDVSPAHFRLCQAAWSLAVEMYCEFARDADIVDTRISLSQDALASRIFTSVWNHDAEFLIEALKDPRADVRDLWDNDRPVFEIWLDHLHKVDFLEGLTVIKMMLSTGAEVNQPNRNGLLPIHQLAMVKFDKCALPDGSGALCEIVREFLRRGTGCDARSQNNQNVLHLGSGSLYFIEAVLKTASEEDVQTALRTRDEQGNTPIAFALQAGREEVALLLLERTNCNHETLSGPISVYAHCVTGGASRAFNALLDAGVELEPTGAGRKTLLHYVGPRTGDQFVRQLIRMSPDGLRCRIDARIPLDTYFESCIDSQQPLDADVVRLLAGSGSDKFDQGESQISYEYFILCIQNLRHLRNANPDGQHGWREHLIAKAITHLLQLRPFGSNGADAQFKWILQFLKPLRRDLANLWPVSSEAIRNVLEHTTVWESLRGSAAILRLLRAAINSCDVDLAGVLLKNGVSVHQRIDEMSALEAACLHPASSSSTKQIFTLLLNHSDSSRMNEINPHKGQERGLIHYLTGADKQWQLEELLKRGVNVSLCTNVYVKAQPAVVQHLWQNSSESAMALLDMGANPATTDSRGMDTALAAAAVGKVDVLLHVHASSQEWHLNWKQSCTALVRGTIDFPISGANALHVAAESGHCDVLRFYLDEGLLTDVNAVTLERFTPLHLAALGGHVDTIKFLHSRGAVLDLKLADGSLPLHLAVQNEHLEVVEFLVENGSAMDADMHGLTPVGYAVQLQNQSILDCLHATKQYLDYQSQPRRRSQELVYAYEQALIRGDVEECERLRGQGCPVNVDLSGQNGRTGLVLAIENSNEKLAKWLLEHDAKATCRTFCASRGLLSPVHVMMTRPALGNLLPLLLRKYRNEGGSISRERPSLICAAIVCGNNLGLKLLLEHVAIHETTDQCTDEVDHSSPNESPLNQHRSRGGSPLHIAASQGNCEAVKMLIDHGANVDIFDDRQRTPLQVAIEHEPSTKSPAAKLLLQLGTALELRNHIGQTALLSASQRGLTELIQLLDEAGADMRATDFESWTCLHSAAHSGHLELFVWLVGRGLPLHAKNSRGQSAVHYASLRMNFSSFLLSLGSAFDDNKTITYASPEAIVNMGPAWLNEHFDMYLRRLGPERLRAWANLEPADSWSPLCMLASIGRTLAVTNILRLGADVDFEGSPSGSALMAACAAGRLEPVKILIRHGASISYPGPNGIRSAVNAARNYQAIVAWLLVDRFTEQRKISGPAEIISSAHTTNIVKGWSGIAEAELIITGTDERQVHESALNYWIRLMAVKKGWRGRIVHQNERVQTHRPSRLTPVESVRICPGDYGVSKEQK